MGHCIVQFGDIITLINILVSPEHLVDLKLKQLPNKVSLENEVSLFKLLTSCMLHISYGEQGWLSGESTCIWPMCLGFDSQLWVCWFSTLLQKVFHWVLRFSPLLKNQHLVWFDLCWVSWVDLNCFDLKGDILNRDNLWYLLFMVSQQIIKSIIIIFWKI